MHWYKYISLVIMSLFLQVSLAQYNSKFVNIYVNIFNKECAKCHDGSFEPDFTSLMGSYNTLVYQPIIKNNTEKSFKYRVVPFDYKQSILYERITNNCFVDNNDRMPFYDKDGLNKKDIALIKDWINEGAADIFGNIPKKIATLPHIGEIQIFSKVDSHENNIVIKDYIRNSYNEILGFKLKNNSLYNIKIYLSEMNANAIETIKNSKLTIVSTENNIEKTFPLYYDINSHILKAIINTDQLQKNILYTIQFYNKELNFTYPSDSSDPYTKARWSFSLQ
ncbi:MAG: hypothetical protein ACI93N_001907 [Flavobacteriaceae bacterium]|jgi:hypothetical protein